MCFEGVVAGYVYVELETVSVLDGDDVEGGVPVDASGCGGEGETVDPKPSASEAGACTASYRCVLYCYYRAYETMNDLLQSLGV